VRLLATRTARLQEIVRFGVVGVTQNVTNIGLFALLVALDLPYLAAAVAAAIVALALSYWLNRTWTFRHAAVRAIPRQATQYMVIFVLASLGAIALLALFTEVAGLPKVLAQALSLATMAPLSYVAQRLLTFRG
jgi:putative flippase GtrA